MRLINCYIENFGGLSRYSLTLQPGITVVEEPNGFGKTTLAEFIRAMFYGFPRASKTLEKNTRKRYQPWQGGRYGGTIIFEHNGKTYRIDRTFGDVPRQDTFALYEAGTHRPSTDFSENIGQELFQLDADSFERSTYLPQLHDRVPLTTASIQAKLGNLVEDTNDINNFDKAVAALRARRSSYIPFRGSGGTVAEAQAHISRLQSDLSNADNLYAALERSQKEAAQLTLTKKQKEGALESIRRDIVQASQAAARESLFQQYESLRGRQAQDVAALDELTKHYPAGFPTKDELDHLRSLYDQVLSLNSQIVHTEADRDAEALIAANTARFAAGVPDDNVFRERQEQYQDLVAAQSALLSARLSPEEEDQLANLEKFFCPGVPDESFFTQFQTQWAQLQQLRSAKKALGMSPEDAARLSKLEVGFAVGLPTAEELAQTQAAIKCITTLLEENVRLAAAQIQEIRTEPLKKKGVGPLPLLLLLLGGAALLGGVLLLVGQAWSWGGIGLGLGTAFILAAAYLNLRHTISNELVANRQGSLPLSDRDRAHIKTNEQEIAAAEAKALEFLSRYTADNRPLSERFWDVQAHFSDYTALKQKETEIQTRSRSLECEISELESRLAQQLQPYFLKPVAFDEALLTLQSRKAQLEQLRQKKQSADAYATALKETVVLLQEELSAFLRPFCGEVAPENFNKQLAALQRDWDAYERARKLIAERMRQTAQRDKALENCTAAVHAFSQQYSIQLDLRDRPAFQSLCDDVRRWTELTARVNQNQTDVEQFYLEHRSLLQSTSTSEVKDLDGLKRAEQHLSHEIASLSQEILEMEQRVQALQVETDRIPEKRDELETWKQKKEDGVRSCALLDQAIHFLYEAREALSHSYLGTIRQSFAGYLHRMTGEDRENIIVTPTLDVQIERLGQARESAYFSAGLSDIITLCMRLALVDALFKKAKPFIILDDPFVNLDDAHTEKALKLLENLGADHQILYLICNSSRRISD